MSQQYHVHTIGKTSLVNYTNAPDKRWDTYIGRESKRNRLPQSPHANPFRMKHYSRTEAVELFTLYFYYQIKKPGYRTQVNLLEGRTLCCWCVPKDCHGDIILNWINGDTVSTDTLEMLANKYKDYTFSPLNNTQQTIIENAIENWM